MIRRRRRVRLAVATVLLTVAVAAWWFWPQAASPAVDNPPADTAPEGAEFSEARIVGRRRGQRQWVVDTHRLREESDQRVRAERIDSGTLYRESSPYLDVQALEAVAHRVTNDLTLTGEVVATHKDGAVLRTDTLQWVADQELLIAPGPVTVERGNEWVVARRMEVDWSRDVVHLLGDVTMERETGHWLRAERVDYQMDGEDVWVRGSFRAAVPTRRDTERGDDETDGG